MNSQKKIVIYNAIAFASVAFLYVVTRFHPRIESDTAAVQRNFTLYKEDSNQQNDTLRDVSKSESVTIPTPYEVIRYPNSSKTSFIVLYHGSQGSTWFVETLSEYRGICILGNELIDRVKDKYRRLAFIEQATQAPNDQLSFSGWKTSMFNLATEPTSPMDAKLFGKCSGIETVLGYKARLSFEEMKYVLSNDVQSRLGIKVIVLSRNPVKQAVSAYRRDYEHHDQRIFNMLVHQAEDHCLDRSPSNPYCKEKADELLAAKRFQSSIDFGAFEVNI